MAEVAKQGQKVRLGPVRPPHVNHQRGTYASILVRAACGPPSRETRTGSMQRSVACTRKGHGCGSSVKFTSHTFTELPRETRMVPAWGQLAGDPCHSGGREGILFTRPPCTSTQAQQSSHEAEGRSETKTVRGWCVPSSPSLRVLAGSG